MRPYCVCDACGFAAAPLDYALGIPRKGPSVSRRELISDAANGILALHAEHFPNAALIIDWYHAAERLSLCAKAAFPASPAQSTQWFEAHKSTLWNGQVRRVAHTIRTESQRVGRPPPKAPDTDPRVVLHRGAGYFTDHQHAMDYPTYRAHGWPIGSGVAEGSVKQFGLRVKGSEKFWNVWGAEEMLALCALHSSEDGRWATYWKARATPPADAERLYASTH